MYDYIPESAKFVRRTVFAEEQGFINELDISFFTIQMNILMIKSNQQMIKTKASVRDNRRLLFFLYKWHICVLCIRKSFDTGFLFLDFFQGQKSV